MSAQEISSIFRRYVELGTLVADLVEGKSSKSEMLVKIISSDMDRLVMLLKEPAEQAKQPIKATTQQAAPAVEQSAYVDLSLLSDYPKTQLGAVPALQTVPFHQVNSQPNSNCFNLPSTLAMAPSSTYDYAPFQFQPQADPFVGYLQGFNPNQPFQFAQPVAGGNQQSPAALTGPEPSARGRAQAADLLARPSGVGPVKTKKEHRGGGQKGSKRLRCDEEDDDGNECGLLFFRESYLEKHKETSHYADNPKPYLVCALCKHGYANEEILKTHARKCQGDD